MNLEAPLWGLVSCTGTAGNSCQGASGAHFEGPFSSGDARVRFWRASGRATGASERRELEGP